MYCNHCYVSTTCRGFITSYGRHCRHTSVSTKFLIPKLSNKKNLIKRRVYCSWALHPSDSDETTSTESRNLERMRRWPLRTYYWGHGGSNPYSTSVHLWPRVLFSVCRRPDGSRRIPMGVDVPLDPSTYKINLCNSRSCSTNTLFLLPLPPTTHRMI